VIGLSCLPSAAAATQRRLLIEVLLVVAVAANLPGLVLEIPGGDAFFFLSAMNWLAAPLAVMVIAALPIGFRGATAVKRGLVYGLIGVAVLEALIDGATRTDDRVFTAISGAALLHTGDVTYYTDDRRKIWKADTERALKEHGLFGLYRLQPPVPTGAGLAEMLATDRATAPISLYIPPEAGYWNWIKDCDGRSLWPMAASGVPLIDGYVPDQAACEQSFALIGYGTPPATRTRLEAGDVCRRADAMGLPLVREIDSVEDRSRDRTTLCPPLH
jgi:hypothetical protein